MTKSFPISKAYRIHAYEAEFMAKLDDLMEKHRDQDYSTYCSRLVSNSFFYTLRKIGIT